jgi:hypothetical protein
MCQLTTCKIRDKKLRKLLFERKQITEIRKNSLAGNKKDEGEGIYET